MRTLALAFRDLSEEEWEVWSESQRLADKATDCREDRLAAVYDKIEQDMMVSQIITEMCNCLTLKKKKNLKFPKLSLKVSFRCLWFIIHIRLIQFYMVF